MPRKTHHVVPNTSGGWSVKKGGASKATRTFTTKMDAISCAREISKNQKSELVIHKKDGTIQSSVSHAADSMPPRDTDTNKKKKS